MPSFKDISSYDRTQRNGDADEAEEIHASDAPNPLRLELRNPWPTNLAFHPKPQDYPKH
jgi:hypothetical protein